MADEATAVNETVDQATTTPESAAEETKELEVVREGEAVEPELYEKSETESESESESPEGKPEASDTDKDADAAGETQEDKPLGEKGQRRLQQLANEKRELKERIKELEAAVPKPEAYDIDKAIEERGLTPEQARIEAIEQRQKAFDQQAELQAESSRIYELNAALLSDADNVVRDFPELDENNKERYDPELTKNVVDRWHKWADVQYAADENGEMVVDKNGNPIITNARFSLYDFVANINDFGTARQRQGEIQGQKAAEQNLSAVEPKPMANKPRHNAKEDSNLSADAYAEKYGLKVQR